MGLYISEDEYYVDAANHKVGPMRRLPEDADSAAVWSGECLNAKGEPCGLRHDYDRFGKALHAVADYSRYNLIGKWQAGMEVMNSPLFEFRIVRIDFEKGSGSSESVILHKDHVERYITAKKQLHVDPGINPYNKEVTAQASVIEVFRFSPWGPFWHTTPGLGTNDDQNGAIEFKESHMLRESQWLSEAEQKRRDDYHRMEDEYENRNVTPESVQRFVDMLQPAIDRGVAVTIITD